VIRHLIGRGDVLTDCGLTRALPGTLMTDMENVNCRDCRRSQIAKGVCPACGEKKLSWGTHPHKLNSVPDGRLTARDIETIFYLACDYCSETLLPQVDPEVVAAALTKMGWVPE
jgi:hypothetical protein